MDQPRSKQQRKKQQQQTTRKRGRRLKAGGGAPSAAAAAIARSTSTTRDDSYNIEEQLRRQRLKKQQQEEDKYHKQNDDTPGAKQPAPRLGSYVYDPERQTYFEESFLVQQQQQQRKHLKQNNDPEEFREYHKKRNSITAMSYARELCGNERTRRKLTWQWRGRQLLAQLRLEPSMPPSTNEDHARLALSWPSPKETPWSRTFDVVASNSDAPPSLERIEHAIGFRAAVPRTYGCCAPGFMGGSEVTHLKVLGQRMVEMRQSESECHVTVSFQLKPNANEHRHCYNVTLPPSISDCTSLQHHGSCPVLFAGGRRLLRWSDPDLDGNTGGFRCSPHIPASDILTVENLDHNFSSSSLVLGHRNGQVSLQDLRATSASSCSQLPSSNKNINEFGSIVALHPLNQHRPYQILARSGGVNGGHCRLFDVRMFSSSSAATTTQPTHHRSSVVHELRIPDQQHGKNRISKGIATDPSQTVALAPFVDDTTNTAQIGVWSLDSGMFVGSKPVASATTIPTNTDNSAAAAIDCLELCPKITRTWTMGGSDGDDSPMSVPGSFSLWLNCGSHGIRQIICDGRWDDDP